ASRVRATGALLPKRMVGDGFQQCCARIVPLGTARDLSDLRQGRDKRGRGRQNDATTRWVPHPTCASAVFATRWCPPHTFTRIVRHVPAGEGKLIAWLPCT